MAGLLKIFLGLELFLAVIAVLTYFATADANDFSGLAIVYPIIAMFFVGILAIGILIYQKLSSLRSGANAGIKQHPIRSILLLLVFSVPVLYVVIGATGVIFGKIIIGYLLVVALHILLSGKNKLLDKTINLFLLAIPVIAVLYAGTLDDFSLLVCSAIIGGILFVTTLRGLLARRNSHPR